MVITRGVKFRSKLCGFDVNGRLCPNESINDCETCQSQKCLIHSTPNDISYCILQESEGKAYCQMNRIEISY